MKTKLRIVGQMNVKPTRCVAASVALALGFILSPAGYALDVDANGNAIGQPAVAAVESGDTLVKLPLEMDQDFSYGAVAQSSAPVAGGGGDEAAELAKQLSNPVASLISVPFQANEDFGYGPSHNGYKFTLNFQPVIPISLNKDWTLILRTIVPIVSQHDLFYVENVPKKLGLPAQNRSQDGLSDTLQSFFFSPKKPGPLGLIWGLGPALLYPTGTNDLLGTGTFSIGPTLVVLKQAGPWTVGALMNQLWSVAIEDHRKSLSQMYVQPFLAYATKTHTTFTINTEATANWDNTPGDAKWTVPIIGTISQILKIGKQPISIAVAGKYYADSPRYGPDWGVRFVFTLLYPTGRPNPAPMPKTDSKDK